MLIDAWLSRYMVGGTSHTPESAVQLAHGMFLVVQTIRSPVSSILCLFSLLKSLNTFDGPQTSQAQMARAGRPFWCALGCTTLQADHRRTRRRTSPRTSRRPCGGRSSARWGALRPVVRVMVLVRLQCDQTRLCPRPAIDIWYSRSTCGNCGATLCTLKNIDGFAGQLATRERVNNRQLFGTMETLRGKQGR